MGRYHNVEFKTKVVNSRYSGMKFDEISRKFHVAKSTAISWCQRYQQQGVRGLVNKQGGGPKRNLTRQFFADVCARWILRRNRHQKHASYKKLAKFLRRKKNIHISPALLQKYGHEFGFRRRRAKTGNRYAPNKAQYDLEKESALFAEYLCSNFFVDKLIFTDEKCVYSTMMPISTLFLGPGIPYLDPRVSTLAAQRYDLVHSCTPDGLFGEPLVITPSQRQSWGTKGITAKVYEEEYIMKCLVPAINAYNRRGMIVVMDNARIHRGAVLDDMLRMHCGNRYGCLVFIPPYTAKFLSPLDNGYHSSFDHHYRNGLASSSNKIEEKILQVIAKSYRLSNHSFPKYYRNCGLLQ